MNEIDWKEEAKNLAYELNALIGGADLDDAVKLLARLGFIDDEGFWIESDED